MNLPQDFITRMQELLKEEFDSFLSGYQNTKSYGLRVNPLKYNKDPKALPFTLTPVPWAKEGFYAVFEEHPGRHPLHESGAYYIQEPSAMSVASLLQAEPGDIVCDLCAAPGGKSTQIAGHLAGKGMLLSNEIYPARAKILSQNIERLGVGNSVVCNESPDRLADHFPLFFQKIVVDAPCSGEGMFRREPSMVKSWSLEEVDRYAELQREILCHAAQMVKPGGYLLYSTCTFAREEDEQTVEYFLEQNADFSLQELPICDGIEEGRPEWTVSGREDVKNCRRFLPYKVRGEGHFAALFKKREEADCLDEVFEKADRKQIVKEQAISKEKIPDAMEEFMRDIPEWKQWKKRLFFIKERAFLLPEHCPDLRGLRIVRSGLYLGDCLKKRFEPSQALAMALHPSGYKRSISFPAEDIRVEKYLRGETVDMDDSELSGWTLFCVDEFPLGWGKCNRGRLKNKYNPGWRKL